MTKEELKQEVEEWLNKWELCNKCDHKVQCIEDNAICPQVVERAYLASAEPREKEIKVLGERCLQLQKDKGELIDKVRELEEKLANADYQLEGRDLEIKELKAENELIKNSDSLCKLIGEQKLQIEKMKCCFNCKHSRTEYEHCKTDKHEKWEMKEK